MTKHKQLYNLFEGSTLNQKLLYQYALDPLVTPDTIKNSTYILLKYLFSKELKVKLQDRIIEQLSYEKT